MGDRRQRLVPLARSCHGGPCVAVTAMAVAMAAATGRRPVAVAGVGAAVLSGHVSVGWHNDWVDAERDRRVGRTDKPAAADPAVRRAVGTAAGVSLACCVPLSLLSGRRAAAAHLAGVALAWGYNAGLKATAWSWVPYGASFALLVTFVEEGRPGRPGPEWWELPAAALLGVGAHFANVIPDLERDEANGVRGLPNRLGRRGSVAATIGAVLGASALVALGPRRRDRAALGFPAGVALLAAGAAGERRRPGTLFRATIAVALVDVALLVSRVRRRS